MGATISLAKQELTDIVQHINDVDKEKEIYFTCVGCGKEMIAVKSVARKRDWHFRHKIDSDCTGGRDAALHNYAVQVVMSATEIVIAKNFKIAYSNSRKEAAVLNKRSDIAVTYQDSEVHFEVFVTHGLDREKEAIYKDNEIRCVVIDLSDSLWLAATPEKIRETILNEHKNKIIIFWNRQDEAENIRASSIVQTLLLATSAIGLVFLFKWLFQRNKMY